MTLILGGRCIDGVDVEAVRKIIDQFTGYDDTVFGVLLIFAYAGAQAMSRVFLRYVAGDVILLRDREENIPQIILFQNLAPPWIR
jgi:hypothetical protein